MENLILHCRSANSRSCKLPFDVNNIEGERNVARKTRSTAVITQRSGRFHVIGHGTYARGRVLRSIDGNPFNDVRY